MVDVCLALIEQGFEGPIHGISRRGLLPLGHAPSKPWERLMLTAEDRRSLLALFGAVRREVRHAGESAVGWRAVIDAVRPHAQMLWAELSPADKARFVRHVRPWWDVHRHRMAPQVAATLAALRASGAVATRAGRITSIRPAGRILRVRWRPKGESGEEQLLAQRVIDCTGSTGDHCRSGEPLIRQLLADGLVRPAPLGLGVDCTSWGALIGAHGHPSPSLFAVGPVTRGALWEIVAVPEIRTQAEQVAERVLAVARTKAAA
jgi:uncharacterized NAD(P)/FAD-binding protein YdhS